MSTESQLSTFALQDILIGIAGSLNDAQQSLNERPPYDAFGRPNTMYTVPHLDLNLQVTSEFESVSDAGSGSGSASGFPTEAAPGSKCMKFAPATSPADPSASKTAIYSTISGRFVATVPNEGLPQTVIQVKSESFVTTGSHEEIDLEVVVSNAAGEVLPDSLVEYNYDEATSDSLNDPNPLSSPPTFDISELRTDSNGKATARVSIPVSDYTSGKFTVIEVSVGTVVKSISLSNQ